MSKQAEKGTQIRLWELPQELIQRGRVMADRGHDIWLAGLGAVATVEEEGTTLFDTLVARGQKVEEAGKRQAQSVRQEVATRGEEIGAAVEEKVYEPILDALRRFGVPIRGELKQLAGKVDTLARRVDALAGKLEKGKAAGPTPTVFYVVAREDGDGWVVRKEGRESAIGAYPVKEEAVEAGRLLASQHLPSRLTIYKKDGAIQDTFTYAG